MSTFEMVVVYEKGGNSNLFVIISNFHIYQDKKI